MKKYLIALCLGAVAVGASAANYLHIKTSTGWEVLDLDKVDRLTFSNGQMKVQDEKGATVGSYNQSSLEQIYVNDLAGVEAVIADEKAKATFHFDAANRSAIMVEDGNFEVYALDGSLLVAVPAKAGERIGLDAMGGTGVVIVKSGKYAIKAAL